MKYFLQKCETFHSNNSVLWWYRKNTVIVQAKILNIHCEKKEVSWTLCANESHSKLSLVFFTQFQIAQAVNGQWIRNFIENATILRHTPSFFFFLSLPMVRFTF